MTVTWHVDDLEVSQVDPFRITKFACYLQSIYREKLTVKWDKVHHYVGMGFGYSKKGTDKVSMIKYVGKIPRAFPEVGVLESFERAHI